MRLLYSFLFARVSKLAALLTLSVFMLVVCLGLPTKIEIAQPGGRDFVQYWGAYSLIKTGANPYEPSQMLATQRSAGLTELRPIMYWSPPWFIALAKPVLDRDFSSSAALWMRISILLYLVTILLGALASQRGPTVLGLVVPLLFAPFYDALRWGQSSTVLACMVALCFYLATCAARPGTRAFICGAVLPIATLKPHLFILVAAYGAISFQRWRVIMRPLLLGVLCTSALFGLVFLGLPAPTTQGWLSSLQITEHSEALASTVDARVDWITPTVSGMVRLGLFELTTVPATASAWIMFLIPILGVVLVLATHTWWSRRISGGEQTISLFIILALSLLCAPYGWYYDSVILAAPLAALLCDLSSLRSGLALLSAVLGCKILTPLLSAQHEFVILTIALLIAACVTGHKASGVVFTSLPTPRRPTKDTVDVK